MKRMNATIMRFWARAFGTPCCRRLNNLLVNLGTAGLGVGCAVAERNGELRVLRRLAHSGALGPSPVVFDVGANEGHFTAATQRFWPAARIHAFEPHPATFERLQRLHPMGGRVKCHPIALGARSGDARLWDYSDFATGSSHATLHPGIVETMSGAAFAGRPVAMRTIDEIVAEEAVDAIAFLKLDVEGHELECLRGAARTLERSAVGFVQFEFNAMHLEARAHMADFAELLDGHRLLRILPGGLLPIDLRDPMLANLYRMQNVIAIPRHAVRAFGLAVHAT